MNLVILFKAPGLIFGPLMLLATVVAVVACVRAAVRGDRFSAKWAEAVALVPPAVGVAGAVSGGLYWAASGQSAGDKWAEVWMLLGFTVLWGDVVAAVPLFWARAMLKRRPAVKSPSR